jgi:hypothetical protein
MGRPNPFRPEYRDLKSHELIRVEEIKDKAFELLCLFEIGTRESAIAATKLEEAVMWAVKGETT